MINDLEFYDITLTRLGSLRKEDRFRIDLDEDEAKILHRLGWSIKRSAKGFYLPVFAEPEFPPFNYDNTLVKIVVRGWEWKVGQEHKGVKAYLSSVIENK